MNILRGGRHKKFWKKVSSVVTIVFVVTALSIAALGILMARTAQSPWKLFIVTSGSMQPVIPVGSLVVTRTASSYQIGDIVTFRSATGVVTHRIVAQHGDTFQTRGDANNSPDATNLANQNIVGKLWFMLPTVGRLIDFIKTPFGYAIFFGLPAMFIMIQELLVIHRELTKLQTPALAFVTGRGKTDPRAIIQSPKLKSPKRKRKGILGKTTTRRKGVAQKTSQHRIALAGLAVLVAVGSVAGNSKAYFSDAGLSSANMFTTGAITPPPDSGSLLIQEVMYHSSCKNPDEKQWIELWNGSNHDIDLVGWQIKEKKNNVSATIDDHTILSPGAFILLSRSAKTFDAKCDGQAPAHIITLDLRCQEEFNDHDGIIQLIDPSGVVQDRVEYGNHGRPSALIDQSIERKTLGLDSGTGDTFVSTDFEKRFPSTPGFALPSAQSVVINEFQIQPDRSEFVELYNRSTVPMNISGWQIKAEDFSVVTTLPANTTLPPGARTTITYKKDWSNRGQKIYLTNTTGAIMDAFNYHLFVPPSGSSWSRIPDGSSAWKLDDSPTPDKVNVLKPPHSEKPPKDNHGGKHDDKGHSGKK